MAKQPAKKKCFVASVISERGTDYRDHADCLLEYIIRPVFRDHFSHYSVERSDDIPIPGLVDAQVIGRLLDDDLVIADMTFLNPNVFYEMGLRHMAAKPIIHMILDTGVKIPFDVTAYRAVVFRMKNPEDVERAKTELKRQVQMVEADGYQTENPVTKARGNIKLRETASPSEKVILDRLEAIEARLSSSSAPQMHFPFGRPSSTGNQVLLLEVRFDPNQERSYLELVRKTVSSLVQSSFEVIGQEFTQFNAVYSVRAEEDALASIVQKLGSLRGIAAISVHPFAI